MINMNENTAIFIQARKGSTRLPNKIVENIEGRSMIWHVINRIKKSKVKRIVLLTSNLEEDKHLKKISDEHGVEFFSGSEVDVLDRFYQCAKLFKVDNIIRITGDCPLIDPQLVDKINKFYMKNKYDYVSNTIKPTFPDGLDVEIFSFSTLEKTNMDAKLTSEREHVTSYIIKHPAQFKLFNVKNEIDLSKHRWTVDEPIDLEFVRKIYSLMKPKLIFYMNQILELLTENPEITKINSHIKRNEGF